MLKTLFRKDPVRSQAETLYAAIAEQARAPEFYGPGRADDTPEGRFDLLALHMFLAIDRLRRAAPATDKLVQRLQERFFEGLDSALREMGVGDLVVARKIRSLAEAFYGRYGAYQQAQDAGGKALAAAIARNVLSSNNAADAATYADYVRSARCALGPVPIDALAAAVTALKSISMEHFGGGGDDATGA